MKLPAIGAQSISQAQLPEPSEEELAEIAEDLGLVNPTPPDLAPGPPDSEEAYPDWSPDTSYVVSGPLGLRATYPGTRFTSWRQAEAAMSERFGPRVVKFWCFANRWYVRVRK